MAAGNDMYADALSDMEEMKQGFSETGPWSDDITEVIG
jgi:hypothetical protein